jgi:hypothetical protein
MRHDHRRAPVNPPQYSRGKQVGFPGACPCWKPYTPFALISDNELTLQGELSSQPPPTRHAQGQLKPVVYDDAFGRRNTGNPPGGLRTGPFRVTRMTSAAVARRRPDTPEPCGPDAPAGRFPSREVLVGTRPPHWREILLAPSIVGRVHGPTRPKAAPAAPW